MILQVLAPAPAGQAFAAPFGCASARVTNSTNARGQHAEETQVGGLDALQIRNETDKFAKLVKEAKVTID